MPTPTPGTPMPSARSEVQVPVTVLIRTTAVLDDLLTNTLDPGYRTAAARSRRRHWWEQPLAWLGCLVIGFVFVVAYQQSHRSAPARATARKDLIARITALEAGGNRIGSQIKNLSAEVSALRAARLSGPKSSALQSQEISSGTVAVTGPGVRVELGEPVGRTPTVGLSSGGVTISDFDVRAVVNQLWVDGAEAIAVDGVRLTPTSTIRIAGNSILVDFQPISSPYTVEALGGPDPMLIGFASSAEARALTTKKAVQSISFTFGTQPKLHLAAGGIEQLRYAQIGAASSASGSGTTK